MPSVKPAKSVRDLMMMMTTMKTRAGVLKLVLAFLVGGVAAYATEACGKEPVTAIPKVRPVVEKVTFTGNPITVPDYTYEEDETTKVCSGFSLTEDEIRDYFRVAEFIYSYDYYNLGVSTCLVRGNVVLKDGKKATFEIDQDRQGRLLISGNQYLYYYCTDCKDEKFAEICDLDCFSKGYYFTPGPNGRKTMIPKVRPVVKKVTFTDNPAIIPDPYSKGEHGRCDGFKLTEDEVRDYFRRAGTLPPYGYIHYYLDVCPVRGSVVLENGKKATFEIDRGRQGYLYIGNHTLYYYCDDCENKKFLEPCDLDCTVRKQEMNERHR